MTWIWLGAIVVFLGGLIALWPGSDAARAASRRATRRASPKTSAARKRGAAHNHPVDVVALLVIVAVLVAVVAIVATPLRGSHRERRAREAADEIAELEARKEAKYREIRDAEMDLRTGKLSEEDHRVLDRQLRAEAVVILKALDDAGAPGRR